MKLYFSPGSVSLQVWPQLTKLAYQKQLELAQAANGAAVPHLMVLVDEQTEPSARLAAAQWLRVNDVALPAAITAFMELAFDGDRQIANEALAQLAVIDHPEALKALEGLVKWGPTKGVRLAAAKLLKLRRTTPFLRKEEIRASPPRLGGTEGGRERGRGGEVPPPQSWGGLRGGADAAGMEMFLRLLRHDEEQSWWLPSFVLVLTTIAELLTLFPDPRSGMLLHIAILFLLLYSLFHAVDAQVRRLNTVLLLIPLIRLLSLGLPLFALPRLAWYFATSIPLFVAMMMIIRQERWSWQELGLTVNRLPLQVAFVVSGLGLGWIEYSLLSPTPLATELTWQAIWLPALVLLISTGYLEELLFRGLLQSAAISVIGRRQGLLFGAALFAVMHIGYASLLDVLFVFSVGLAFGLFVDHTRSLVGVTLAHGLTNFGLFILWPLWLG